MSRIQLHNMHSGGGALVANVIVACRCDPRPDPVNGDFGNQHVSVTCHKRKSRLVVCGERLMTSSRIDRLQLLLCAHGDGMRDMRHPGTYPVFSEGDEGPNVLLIGV